MAMLDRAKVEEGYLEFACALAGAGEITLWWDGLFERFTIYRTNRGSFHRAPITCATWDEAIAALDKEAGYAVSQADYWYSYPCVPF